MQPLSETLSPAELAAPAVLTLRLDQPETLGENPAAPLLALLIFHSARAMQLLDYLWLKQQANFGTQRGADVPEEQAQQAIDQCGVLRLSVAFPSGLGNEDVEVAIVREPQHLREPKWAQALGPYIIPLDGEYAELYQNLALGEQPLTPGRLARQVVEKFGYENSVELADELYQAKGFDITPGGVRLLIYGQYSGEYLPSHDISNATLRAVQAHLHPPVSEFQQSIVSYAGHAPDSTGELQPGDSPVLGTTTMLSGTMPAGHAVDMAAVAESLLDLKHPGPGAPTPEN